MWVTTIFLTIIAKKCRKRAPTNTNSTFTFTPLQHIDRVTFAQRPTCVPRTSWKCSRAGSLTALGFRIRFARDFMPNVQTPIGFLSNGSHLISRTMPPPRVRLNPSSGTLVVEDSATGAGLLKIGRTIIPRMTITKYQGDVDVLYFAPWQLVQDGDC